MTMILSRKEQVEDQGFGGTLVRGRLHSPYRWLNRSLERMGRRLIRGSQRVHDLLLYICVERERERERGKKGKKRDGERERKREREREM